VPLARPRDRAAVNHDPEFKRIRNEITHYLTVVSRQAAQAGPKRRLKKPDARPATLRPPSISLAQ
jgi:nitrate/nitrite transport system ATP-binding protein